MTQRIFVDPRFGSTLRVLRERRNLSLRRLGSAIHVSHGFIWDLEVGSKKPSLNVAALLDAALDAGGQLSAMVRQLSADGLTSLGTADVTGDPASAALEFAADWRHGIEAVVELWRTDMQRRDLLNITGFSALAFMTPAMRWLTNPLDEQPTRSGVRIVGEPDIEMVRRITGAFRTLDNQFGGGHVRESVVRFLDGEVAPLLTGHFDARTGTALLSAAAEATQLAGWASYDAGMHGLAQRYMIQALRLAAAAHDRPLGAEVLAAMSHQARWLRRDALKPWQFRSWIAPRAANFAGRAAVVLDLYAGTFDGEPLGDGDYVLCSDEKTSIQCRCRCHPTLPPGRARLMRVEHEYDRGGALSYLAAWDVHRGKVFGRCEPTTGIAPFGRLVEQVMTQEPYASARRVFWVVDNGSSHRGQASIDRMAKAWPAAALVHTPVHASWLNQCEIYFSVVQRKVVTPNDFHDLADVEARLEAFQDRYNFAARPFNWTYTTKDLDDLLARLTAHNNGPQAVAA